MSLKRQQGFSIQTSHASFDPTDGTTYYYGNHGGLSPSATARNSSIPVPISGTITAANMYWYIGTVGTNETTSVYIRINNTTDVLIGTLDASGSQYVNVANVALNQPINAGDVIQIKLVCPTWATNPLQLRGNGTIFISRGH